jgi:hypothetical protein
MITGKSVRLLTGGRLGLDRELLAELVGEKPSRIEEWEELGDTSVVVTPLQRIVLEALLYLNLRTINKDPTVVARRLRHCLGRGGLSRALAWLLAERHR